METQGEREIFVDGVKVTLNEFQTLYRDPKIKIVEISKGNYKTLQRLDG